MSSAAILVLFGTQVSRPYQLCWPQYQRGWLRPSPWMCSTAGQPCALLHTSFLLEPLLSPLCTQTGPEAVLPPPSTPHAHTLHTLTNMPTVVAHVRRCRDPISRAGHSFSAAGSGQAAGCAVQQGNLPPVLTAQHDL
jgi:hypothetical protein